MSKNRKQVLLIGPYPPPEGGVSIHLKRLLGKSIDHPYVELAILDLRKRIFIDEAQRHAGLFSAFKFFLKSNIVHIHISHSYKIWIAHIVKLFGKKVFFTQHNLHSANDNSTIQMIGLCDKSIFVYQSSNFHQVTVIPAYIPSDEMQPLPVSLQENIKDYKLILIVSSAADSESGEQDIYAFDVVFDAIRINNRDECVYLFIDVNGTYFDRYKNEIAQLINSGINLLYLTSGVNLKLLLQQTSVLIRANRSDGDSLTVREALASGVPVVASDCVSRPEGCILFHTNDASDLALKMESALKAERKIFPQIDYSQQLFELYQQ